jgi:hypothetical protein
VDTVHLRTVRCSFDIWAALTAIGTLAVAVVAIWGDWIRARLAGPQITLALRDARGDLTTRNDGRKEIYFHISVKNHRLWSPAEAVRVLVVGVAKRRPDGSYLAEPLIAPLQLTWAFPSFHELFPTIADSDTCDFGALDEQTKVFRLTTYITPNNFRGTVIGGEAIRATLVASAHNARSKPLVVEVSWDGVWTTDLEETAPASGDQGDFLAHPRR